MKREAPATIEIRRGGRTLSYRLARELVCVERPSAPPDCHPIMELEEEGLVVVPARDAPETGSRRGETRPEPGGMEPRGRPPADAPDDAAARQTESARAGPAFLAPDTASPERVGIPHGRPVYRLEDGPAAFVPSGRLFVRLEPGRRLDDAADAIATLGFEIERVNDWAPHSGSLRMTSGQVGEALGRLDELRARLAAESVEPELLTARR